MHMDRLNPKLPVMSDMAKQSAMTVKDIMSPVHASLNQGDTLAAALVLMSEKGLSCLFICENEIPVGIITEHDIVRVYASQMGASTQPDLPVENIMTYEPVCIDVSSPVEDALVIARSRKIRHLAVLDDNEKLVGVVTQNDAISAYLSSIEVNSKLKADYEALKLLTLEDSMLAAGNRRALDVDLSHTEASARRYGKTYSVAMFDVDYFKLYNDCYGHQRGDEALIKVVELIKTNMREADRIYRYGGEEFLLLMPNTDVRQAYFVCERIRKTIELCRLPHEKSRLGFLSVSVGIASSCGSAEEIIKNADKALYRAKAGGRNSSEKWAEPLGVSDSH